MAQKKRQRVVVEIEGENLSETEVRAFFAERGTLCHVEVVTVAGGERAQTAILAEQLGQAQQLQKWEQCVALVRQVHDPDLLAELDILAEKLGQKNPLTSSVARLQRSVGSVAGDRWWDGANDRQRADTERVMEGLRRAKILTDEKKQQLERIKPFLIPLPAGRPYRRLQLAQDLVREHFRLDSLVAQPQLVDGPLATAFEEFHRLYSQQYLKEWQRFFDVITALRKKEKSVLARARAVQQLSQVPALKTTEEVLPAVKKFFVSLPEVAVIEVEKQLETQPTCDIFALGMLPPEMELDQLVQRIDDALEEQLETLRGLAAEKILTVNDGSDGLKKLLDVLALSQLDELVRLVVGRSGGALVKELTNLTK